MKNIAFKLIFVFILIFSFSFANQTFAQNSTVNYSQTNYVFNNRISKGARGNAVCALQLHLIKAGYLKIPSPTCIFGPLTTTALKNFQQNNNIAPVGSVGPQTRALLNNLNSANNSTNTATNTNTSASTTTSNITTTTNNTNTNTATSSNTVVSNSTPTTPYTPNTPSTPNIPNTPNAPTPITCNGTAPTLTVVHPNGGEVFNAGSQVDVKWDYTCPNLLPTVSLFLEYSNPALPTFVPTVYQILLNTRNDGAETITLPFINRTSQAGPFYILTITDGTAPYFGSPLPTVIDSSNAQFTIQ